MGWRGSYFGGYCIFHAKLRYLDFILKTVVSYEWIFKAECGWIRFMFLEKPFYPVAWKVSRGGQNVTEILLSHGFSSYISVL